MYEKYTDGKSIIYATNRAYEVLYKGKGFKKVEEPECNDDSLEKEDETFVEDIEKSEDDLIDATEQPINKDKEGSNIIGIDDITKAEISNILSQKGIEHNPRDKKEDLYDLMVGSD